MTKQVSVRQRLLDAAYAAMGTKGFETSRIVDIIDAAGVGVGSFYNHFSGKEDLARAVFLSRVDAFGNELEAVVLNAPEIAAAVCYVYRRLIEQAERDPAWGAFVLQLEPLFRMFDRLMRPHARIGLKVGIDNGTLQIDDLEAGITVIHAMMLAVTQAMLAGDLSRQKAHRSSKLALLMFGVPDKTASELSKMSMNALRKVVGADSDTI